MGKTWFEMARWSSFNKQAEEEPKKNMIINKHSQTMAVTSLSGSLLMIIMTYVVFHYPVDVCLSFNPDD